MGNRRYQIVIYFLCVRKSVPIRQADYRIFLKKQGLIVQGMGSFTMQTTDIVLPRKMGGTRATIDL